MAITCHVAQVQLDFYDDNPTRMFRGHLARLGTITRLRPGFLGPLLILTKFVVIVS